MSLAFVMNIIVILGVVEKPMVQEVGKLHILLGFDTNDTTIGMSCKVDSYSIRSCFSALPKNSLASGELEVIDGPLFARRRILQWVDGLNVTDKDTVAIYLSCHGFTKESKHYLQIRDEEIQRDELVAKILAKKAKLSVIITDSCAVARLNNRKRVMAERPQPDRVRIMTDLFIKANGVVNINSASDGERAFGDDQMGGLFSRSFSKIVNGVKYADIDKDNNKQIEWASEFYPRLSTDVGLAFKQLGIEADKYNNINDRGVSELKEQGKQTVRYWGKLPSLSK